MISEGSCDTEDWSNDTEHSSLGVISYGGKPKKLKQNRSYPNFIIKHIPVGIQTLKLCPVCRVG